MLLGPYAFQQYQEHYPNVIILFLVQQHQLVAKTIDLAIYKDITWFNIVIFNFFKKMNEILFWRLTWCPRPDSPAEDDFFLSLFDIFFFFLFVLWIHWLIPFMFSCTGSDSMPLAKLSISNSTSVKIFFATWKFNMKVSAFFYCSRYRLIKIRYISTNENSKYLIITAIFFSNVRW